MDTAKVLTAIKARLNIPDTDASRDALIESYLGEVMEKVMGYCNRLDIPDGLTFTVVGMVEDTYRLKADDPDRRVVTRDKQGERDTTYAGADAYDAIIRDYKAALNRYRRVRIS